MNHHHYSKPQNKYFAYQSGISSTLRSMESVKIHQYQPEYHADVCRLFSQGITEHVPDGIRFSLKTRKIQVILAVIFLLGSVIWNSILVGILMLTLALFAQAGIIFSGIHGYVK